MLDTYPITYRLSLIGHDLSRPIKTYHLQKVQICIYHRRYNLYNFDKCGSLMNMRKSVSKSVSQIFSVPAPCEDLPAGTIADGAGEGAQGSGVLLFPVTSGAVVRTLKKTVSL